MEKIGTWEIFADGASRGNPGAAAYAYVMVKDGTVVKQNARYIGIATNNIAEYQAVIHALEDALASGMDQITLYSDSELVMKQLNGVYRVRTAHLKPLYHRVMQLADRFARISFQAVPRTHRYIAIADRLCNGILDSR